MDLTAVLLLSIPATVMYLLPALIANSRGHPSENSIAMVNLFLGWTFLGWVGALAWAVSAIDPMSVPDRSSSSTRWRPRTCQR